LWARFGRGLDASTRRDLLKRWFGNHRVRRACVNNLVASVKFTGRIGCVGVFVPEDPNSEDKLGRVGKMPFKSLGTGQCNVKAYNRFLSRRGLRERWRREGAHPGDRLVNHADPVRSAVGHGTHVGLRLSLGVATGKLGARRTLGP